MKRSNVVSALLFIALCELAGVVGSVAVVGSVDTWYSALNKPVFAPPNWLFGPAWIVLYALMGIAAYVVWEHRKKYGAGRIRIPMGVFGFQLAVNALWSFLFFGLHSALYGLVDIVVLWLAIVAMMIEFRKISARAAALLIPYLLWVTFATLLNLYILLLN